MRKPAVALRVELHALAQHGWIVLRLRGLHQGGQREHAHAAGNGEEGDDGGEASHERSATTVHYTTSRIRQGLQQTITTLASP